ncbi:hypothetical protein PC113_g3301 [Phytophthora cactorum]|uniref:Uncharacterized protein n=1 Tax=Phytophthora cactorum TaxID=29920 RepID=A0A8T1DGP6_9STRA|nr:hypothetical protein PC113_g3301 [Phytophthora cactorum]KAG2940165.1 hypothetical protein PC115_g2730 [Phytophthora cactorum]
MPSTATQVIERPNRQWKDETSNLVANFEDVARHVEEEASDSGSPIPAEYTALGGDDTLKGMTNFSAPELDALWALVEPAVTITWTQGRGHCRAVLYAQLVKRVKLSEQMEAVNTFTNYQNALYATDVKFQPAYRPVAALQCRRSTSRRSTSCRVSRSSAPSRPPGVAVDVSDRLPGSTADPTTMRDRLSIHRQMLRKEDESNPEKEVDRLSSLKCGLYW